MCVVSMIGDYYTDKWRTIPVYVPTTYTGTYTTSEQELRDLKKEVLEMKELLKRALKYDEEHDQPDCQLEDKLEKLRQVAKLVGVDIDEVLREHSKM